MTDFALRLEDELNYQGLRKADIAAACNLPDSTVRGWFAKDSMPAADTAFKVAKFLNVDFEWLVTGQEKRIQKIQNTDIYSQEEKDMIQKYRSISDHDKNMVRTVLDTAYQASSVKSEIVNEA